MAGRDLPPAVLYCDLDRFKSVNDSLGHAAGDALLRAVAERLTTCLRSRDTAARLGGDEFVVVLEGVTPAEAHEAAERLLGCVHQELTLGDVELRPAMSIGIAVGPAASPEELLRQADAAMYQAKQSARHDSDGRRGGGVAVYDALLAADLLSRLELRSDLQHAVARREFVLHYQPTVDLATGDITGVEALVRWQHPTRGLVQPDEFIAMTEETGLIVELGRWVLDTACAQVQPWQALGSGRPLHLNVNLSGRQLEHPDIVDSVAGVLARTGLDPRRLTLELTESVLLDRSVDMLDRLHALKALGLTLAIDDFGTGYSSLSYLQRLPIDVLKIDKSFVDPLAGGHADANGGLAATIVRMAQTLGLRSVAEGIEHASQAHHLRVLGCDVGQGYLYSRPVPAAELERLLGMGTEPGHEAPLAISLT
jgi:diguanylate cyclase (GGDEF)-like protein